MAETLTLDLVLVDHVAPSARTAAAELRKVEDVTKNAQSELKKFGDVFAKIGMKAESERIRNAAKSVAAEAKSSQNFAAAWAKIGLKAESDRIRKANADAKTAAKAGAHEYKQVFEKVDQVFGGIKQGIMGAGVAALAIGAAMTAGAAAAVAVWVKGVKAGITEGAAFEQLKLAYKLTLGKEQGAGALADIGRFAGQTGYDDDEIAKMMSPLFRAGMRGVGARSAFAAASDLSAAAPGSNPQEFIDLLTKIQLKGGISEKQLVGLGLDAKGFKGELSKTLKTSPEAAMLRAESGKLDPQYILNALYSQIEKRQGGKLGTGTEAFAATMGAKLHLLEQLPSNYLKMIQESDAWPKMTEQVSKLLEALSPDSDRGKQIIGALTSGFEKLVSLAERAFTPENIEKFTKGVIDVATVLGEIPVIIGDITTAASKMIEKLTPALDLLGIATSSRTVQGEESDEARYKGAIYIARQEDDKRRKAAIAAIETQAGPGAAASSPFIDSGDAVRQPTPYKVAPQESNKTTHVTIGKVENHITPPKDDTNHTGQKVAESIQKHTVNAFERSAQEGGGG